MPSRLAFVFGVATLVSCHVPASATPSPPKHAQVTFATSTGPVTLDLEVAATERAREIGLMNRKHLPDNGGMVFVFPEPGLHTFWMKNTLIPLDMVFIDADHRVLGIVPRAEPLSLAGRGVPGASKFVVEVNGGACARLNITPGIPVTFVDLDEHPPS